VASLDPVNAEVVMDALLKVCRTRNIPTIVNLHSIDVARYYCDRVVAMSRGRVVFDDRPQRLTNEALAQIYGASGKWGRSADAVAMETAA
jgi:phosphonate transport system ATP-binding protein